MYDVIIIGAGVIGASIAHRLAKYDMKILVLEKDIEVANGITKANSAIIHAGNDPIPNTLKAKLNLKGNKMMDDLCNELNVDFKRVGSITVAFTDEEVKVLYELFNRAKTNGVKTKIISKEEILQLEPNIKDDVLLGLYAESTGVLAPWDLVYAQLENAIYNGVVVKTNTHVQEIFKTENYFIVKTNLETYKGRFVINAAGLYSETISKLVTKDPGFRTIPTRGQYFVLDSDEKDYVMRVIYPVPTSKGKGVLVVPTIHGNILLGPTSEPIDDLVGTETTKTGLSYIRLQLNKRMINVPYHSIIRTFSGIRPKTDKYDFIIEELKDVANFIQVAGIDSPGLSSAPAIAEYVENILLEKEKFVLKTNYKVHQMNKKNVNSLSQLEINNLIKENPLYGHIICRCEKITEGEIIDSIRRPLGARTIDGVKRRVRAGFGRCQGGFCQSFILNILAKELKIEKTEVLLNNSNSQILFQETKCFSKCNGGDDNE